MCNFIYTKESLREQCHKICGFPYVQFWMCKRKFNGTVPWDFRLQVFSCFSFSQAPEYPIRAIFKSIFFYTRKYSQLKVHHRCHWHRGQIYQWCTLTCEYLQAEFLEKFETTLILFSGAWKKRIHGKNLKQKSRDTVPFKQNISAHRNAMISPPKIL